MCYNDASKFTEQLIVYLYAFQTQSVILPADSLIYIPNVSRMGKIIWKTPSKQFIVSWLLIWKHSSEDAGQCRMLRRLDDNNKKNN